MEKAGTNDLKDCGLQLETAKALTSGAEVVCRVLPLVY